MWRIPDPVFEKSKKVLGRSTQSACFEFECYFPLLCTTVLTQPLWIGVPIYSATAATATGVTEPDMTHIKAIAALTNQGIT